MAEDNVHILDVATKLDIPAERVINALQGHDFHTIVVIGRTEDGELYHAANTADMGRVLVLLESMKIVLMDSLLTEPDGG